MQDYSISGSFGQVRLSPPYQKPDSDIFDWISNAGWHKVNDLYRINRSNGSDTFLLLFTVSGNGKAYIGSKKHILTHDSLLIIPPNTSSGYCTFREDNWEFYWIHLNGKNVEAILSYIVARDGYLHSISSRDIAGQFELLLHSKCNYSESSLFAAKMISKILFDILYALRVNRKNDSKENMVLHIIEYIEENCTKPLHLCDICAEYFISEEYMIRIFRQKTGTTPYNYYHHFKLIKSSQLLIYTDMTIKEIAASFGYTSLSSYSIQFKKEFGVSPSEHRSKNKVYQN